jgi:hypothetical protein
MIISPNDLEVMYPASERWYNLYQNDARFTIAAVLE